MAIITGLAACDLLSSLHHLLVAKARVKWDWLALTSAAATGLVLLSSWWISWAIYGPQPDYNPRLWVFCLSLGQMAVLYLAVRAALPDEVPPEGVDLAAWYEQRSGYIWRALAVLDLIYLIEQIYARWDLLSSSPAGWVVLKAPFIAEWLLFIVLGTTRNRHVHAVLVPFYLLIALGVFMPMRMSG